MMTKWLYILLPLTVSGVAYVILEPRHWGSIRQGLMFTLSLLGAAVLVRLARGMPMSDTEHLEVDEMRRLSRAVKQVYRALIFLFVAVLCSLVGLIFIEVAHAAIAGSALSPDQKLVFQQALTALLVFVVAFALTRTLSLIAGDYDLVQLQAKFMERAVERRQAANRVAQMEEATASKPFESRPGYGKMRQ